MATGSTKFKNTLNLEPLSADPASPAQGDIQFSDGTARAEGYWQYKGGAWSAFGGGAAGINYFTDDNANAENGVGDWVTYADAAGLNPVDGTGGSATVTYAQNTTTPLRDTADFKWVSTAADNQGDGASVAFTIDKADQGQKLTISFDYDTSDAGYADDDIRLSVYDVTNSTLIRINGEDLKGGNGTHVAQFQSAIDSTSYRFIMHQSSTNATGYSLYFDNFEVSPSAKNSGLSNEVVARGESNGGTSITAGTTNIDWTEVEDTAASWNGTQFTAPETGTYLFSGSVMATAVVGNLHLQLYVDAVADITAADEDASGNNRILFSIVKKLTKGEVASFRSGDSITLNASSTGHWIHIQKLGTSAEARASVGGGREITVSGSGNAGTACTADVTDIDFIEVTDSTASWSGTVFTAPETGTYIYKGSRFLTGASQAGVYEHINTVKGKLVGFPSGGTETVSEFGNMVILNKGDTLSLRFDTTVTLSNNTALHFISIQKLASPQTNLQTEVVAAHYKDASGQTVNNTQSVVTWDTKIIDTHNALSAGVYTVPVTGVYNISAAVTVIDTFATTQFVYIMMQINGSDYHRKIV